MHNYITDKFFGNRNYQEYGQNSDVTNNKYSDDENPNDLYIRFANPATLNKNGDSNQSDNRIDLYVGFSPSKMSDVATIVGHKTEQPNSINNDPHDDHADFVTSEIKWNQKTKSNDGSNPKNPLSLHFYYHQMLNAKVFYTNIDGDLIDANQNGGNPVNVNGASANFGHVVKWNSDANGHYKGEAVSGNDVQNNVSDFKNFAQSTNNDGKYNTPQQASDVLNSEGFVSPKVDYSPNGWQAYQKDSSDNAVIFDTKVPSTKNNADNSVQTAQIAQNNGNQQVKQFTASDSVDDLNNGGVPFKSSQGHFVLPNGVSDSNTTSKNPIYNGDSALLMPYMDQSSQHVPARFHWLVPNPSDLKPDYIPTADGESAHGTFDAGGQFVPDDYESNHNLNHKESYLNWTQSKVALHFIEYNPGTGQTHDSGVKLFYDPTVKNDDFVGKDEYYSQSDYERDLDNSALSQLKNDGYMTLDTDQGAANAGAQIINNGKRNVQYFVLPNSTNGQAYIYVSKQGSGSNPADQNDPQNLNHYVPNGSVNPNFNPHNPVSISNFPYIPGHGQVPNDQPNDAEHPNINQHQNIIPSPNYQHVDPNNPADKNGIPGINGWIPSSNVRAIQAKFYIRANVMSNDGGRQLNYADIPVSVDLTPNNDELNKTYTLSNKNIRQAIVNYACSQGYTDKNGQENDLYDDSIMRKPNDVYQPIKYKIVEDANGNYQIVNVNNNTDAGQFMYTPSNVIINYRGTMYKRNAADGMKASDSTGKDQFNRQNSSSGMSDSDIESVIAEGYQGMKIVPDKNNDVKHFLDTTGWTLNRVPGEVFKPIILEGYDHNYMKPNATARDGRFNPSPSHDLGSGLVERKEQRGAFYTGTSFDDLTEQSYLNDEAGEGQNSGQNPVNVDGNGNIVKTDNWNNPANPSSPAVSSPRQLLGDRLNLNLPRVGQTVMPVHVKKVVKPDDDNH